MSKSHTATLLAQLRALQSLTNSEIQVAEVRIAQARTDAVRRELSQNADNARDRAAAIAAAIKERAGFAGVVEPLFGRAIAAAKAITEQAQPFDEALLGDLTLEHQLLDRSRYLKALATSAKDAGLVELADRLVTAHTSTVEWLTAVLAEDALGGPAALRRSPIQAAAGAATQLMNVPVTWSARGVDRAIDRIRAVPLVLREVIGRGANAGELVVKTVAASGDAALGAAESTLRGEGATGSANAVHDVRAAVGVLDANELPIPDYADLTVATAVGAIKDLTSPADVRTVLAYEEAHKNRQGVVSAAQTRIAAIAQEVVGLS